MENKLSILIYEKEKHLRNLTIDKLQASHIKSFLVRPNWSAKTQRTVKSTLSPLLSEFTPNLVQSVRLKKPTSTLHKPFDNVNEVLDAVRDYNQQLYLCCLMTYGCLLRPHREIRELSFSQRKQNAANDALSKNNALMSGIPIAPSGTGLALQIASSGMQAAIGSQQGTGRGYARAQENL